MAETSDAPGIDPVLAAQLKSRMELPARFYKDVTVAEDAGGHHILLDARPVRTPARNLLAVPAARLAEAVAEEWRRQEAHIDPKTMPLTRLVNSAIDGVARDTGAVAQEIVTYAGTDLVCYRAEAPDGLVVRQAAHWDPVIDWLRDAHRVHLILTAGISHVAQNQAALDRIRALVAGRDALSLAALATVTTLTGSAVLALALDAGRLDADAVWAAAHVDEDWQIDLWGADAEASARRAFRRAEFDAAALVLSVR